MYKAHQEQAGVIIWRMVHQSFLPIMPGSHSHLLF